MSELSGSTQLRKCCRVSLSGPHQSGPRREISRGKKSRKCELPGMICLFSFFFSFSSELCYEWLTWKSSTGLIQSDLPRPIQKHAAKWRKQLLNASLTSKFTAHSKQERTWNNWGEQYLCEAQVWLSGAAMKSKHHVWIPTIAGHFTQGGKNFSGIVVGGEKYDLEWEGECFHRNQMLFLYNIT